VIVFEFGEAIAVPAAPPKSTVHAALRFAPVNVTFVPPAVGPLGGLSDVNVGGGVMNVNPFVSVALPLEHVTVTFTAPAA